MRPICIKCNREFRVKRNGVLVHVGNQNYFSADLWECPQCDTEIISGYGNDFFNVENPKDLVVADLSQET